MMIYLSCQGEARQVLNVLSVEEMQEPGGLNRILRLLEESFGVRSDERFEQRQDAYFILFLLQKATGGQHRRIHFDLEETSV